MISDDDLLTAYLTGELDAADAAALEERLLADPGLAARLDALADALVALQGLDDVDVPDGFEQRLAQRLEAESNVVDLAQARQRRARRWYAVGSAAAILAAVTVVGVGFLPRGGQDADAPPSVAMQAEEAAEEAAGDGTGVTQRDAPTEPAAEDMTLAAPEAADSAEGDDEAGGTTAGGSAGSAPAAPAPMAQAAVELYSRADLRRHFRDAGATALLGEPVDGRQARAQREAMAAGDLPCQRRLADGAVVTSALRVRFADEPAVAYAVVTASGEVFDQAHVLVFNRDSCATLARLRLRG